MGQKLSPEPLGFIDSATSVPRAQEALGEGGTSSCGFAGTGDSQIGQAAWKRPLSPHSLPQGWPLSLHWLDDL